MEEERDLTAAGEPVLRQYVYGPGYVDHRVALIDDAGSIYYYLQDRMANVVALADSTGQVVERYGFLEPRMKTLENVAYGPHERQVMDLYLPDGSAGKWPVVVCIHGGGWTSGDKTMLSWTAPRLTSLGLAVSCVNYRLCPEWLFPAALDDVQRAVRWLRHHAGAYGLDGSRLAALGNSAGGHLASFLALSETRDAGGVGDALGAYSSRVSCVVDCYGPVDLVAIMRSASAPIIEKFLGKELWAETVGDFVAGSPIALISAPAAAFLILHGTEDIGVERGQVPIEISRRFAARLREAGGEADFVAMQGAGHGFMAHPEASCAHEALGLIESFLRRHLCS